ncbi:hypothetical protein [Paraburkholderia sp. BL10I2N1]|uniref:hypothetical protein n=1 Tax=Paraburkholderia sp. BL10I2N1 TaxID=1938796 RepID=UPI001414F236|nr:hypothetical protein [Paraburkholderia sp. BL10I2N1]
MKALATVLSFVEGPRGGRLQKSKNEETAMEIKPFKDLVEAVGSAGDALAKITDGIKHLVVAGVEGYDAVKERRAQARLFVVSSGSVDQGIINVSVTSRIRDYSENQERRSDERSRDWAQVLENVERRYATYRL